MSPLSFKLFFFSTETISLATKAPPILVTWPTICTTCLWTFRVRQIMQSHLEPLPVLYDNCCMHALIWTLCIIYPLRKHDGGTNKTAESRCVPPGWTWRGRRWRPVWRDPQVWLQTLPAPVCHPHWSQAHCAPGKHMWDQTSSTRVFTCWFFPFRIRDRAARACGRQLAIIGDQMDREWASREPTWQPIPLHLFRPAQTLRRTIYRYKTAAILFFFAWVVVTCDFSLTGTSRVSYGASRVSLLQWKPGLQALLLGKGSSELRP